MSTDLLLYIYIILEGCSFYSKYCMVQVVCTIYVLSIVVVSKPAISYPSYTPMLIRAQELWFHEPAVTTPVLKLFAELAQNRLDITTFSVTNWIVSCWCILDSLVISQIATLAKHTGRL